MESYSLKRILKYVVMGALIVPCLARLNLAGTDHYGEPHRYIIPLFVGVVIGTIVGLARRAVMKEKRRILGINERLVKEVDARQEAYAGLADREERYREIFNTPADGILVISVLDYSIVESNKTMQEMYGYEEEEFHRLGIELLSSGYAPYVPEELKNKIERVVDEGPQVFIWQSLKRDEQPFWVEISLKSTQFAGEQYAIASIRDISDRVQYQKTLAEEKERLAVTLRSIGDGVITTDNDGNITLINKVAEKLTGWSQSDGVGCSLDEVFCIINSKTRETCKSPIGKVLQHGQIVTLQSNTVLIAKNGVERHIADSAAPIRDWQSKTIGVVVVFRDITNELKTEAELLKVKKLESIEVLAGGIAHDFNNILVAILGNIDLAIEIGGSCKNRSLLADARKASLRAKDLTQQLLTFSKGIEPDRHIVSLGQLVRSSVGLILSGSSVSCEYDIPEDLWMVEVDQSQIRQVMENLTMNSCQAMPDGGHLRIKCENVANAFPDIYMSLPLRDYVKIIIADNGPGIQENIVDNIFDPYFSTKATGSGLGLAVTQSIVDKHDGRILVRSTPGEGTEFTIYLPATRDAEEEGSVEPVEQQSGGKGDVLVMDDEQVICEVAENMLRHLGYRVVTAKDGEQAVDEYRRRYESGAMFDLVILDLTIPGGMGGQEAVERIHAINPDAKVLVSSGYSSDPIISNYKQYGFVGAMTKPFSLLELSRTIRKVLS